MPMAPDAASTRGWLLPEIRRAERRVITAALWIVTSGAVALGVWAVGFGHADVGEHTLVVSASALAATAVWTVTRSTPAVVAVAFIATAAGARLLGTGAEPLVTAQAMLILGVGLVALAGRWRRPTAAAAGAALALTPGWLQGFTTSTTLQGILTVVVFAVALAAVAAVRRLTTAADLRYRHLFEATPVGVLEQDWSAALRRLDRLRTAGVTDLGAELAARPHLVDELLTGVETRRANPAAARMIGLDDPATLVAIPMSRWLTEGNRPTFARLLTAIFGGHHHVSGDYPLPGPDGTTVWVRGNFSALSGNVDRTLAHVAIGVIDITELKTAQQRLADEIRSKDLLIESLTHELRTPLSAVVALSQHLTSEHLAAPTTDADPDLYALLNHQAHLTATIIDNLAAGARLISGSTRPHLHPVDLTALTTQETARPGVAATITPATRAVTVTADEHWTRQILRTLLGQVVHYAPGPATITIHPDRTHATLTLTTPGPALTDTVANQVFHGPPTLFQPTGTSALGTSLAITRALAHTMGGGLTYRHNHHHSHFDLTLPTPDP